MDFVLRDFESNDASNVNEVALAAFQQYRNAYDDWKTFSQNISRMASLADQGELIVVTQEDKVVGAVLYIGPNKPKSSFFDASWPVIRMLVVAPEARGRGIGRLLTEECISRARRDQTSAIALHTSPIMSTALTMYLRMGFVHLHAAPDIHGVPYGVYSMGLNAA